MMVLLDFIRLIDECDEWSHTRDIKSLHWVKIIEREIKFKKNLVDLFWELVRPLKTFNKKYNYQIHTWHRKWLSPFYHDDKFIRLQPHDKNYHPYDNEIKTFKSWHFNAKNILHATTFAAFLSLLMREQVLWFMGWHLNASRRRRSKSWM